MAEALYRKYRPQIFEDVVGQEHIERTLKNAIKTDKVSHAYLFTGPRGTGKTTTARLLAKALLCEHGPTADPDGTCEDCLLIADGEHPDVYELDAASRTGVENVREEIIGRVNYAPTRGRYKVYIIDEVHMLSTAAFNALLKTLEEPPSHVVFILCTTDPQKVPETIHSRCQRFDFRRISSEELVTRLGAICEMEGIEFDGDALDLIAHRAQGGMRDALTSLEQVIAFGEGKVTVQQAERLLGSLDSSELAEIVQAIGKRDIATCFTWTSEYMETGADLAQFTQDLAEHMRNMYVMSLAGADVALDIPEASMRELQAEVAWFGPDRLSNLLGVLGDLISDLKTSTNQRLTFEIALTRMVRPDSDLTMASLAERIEALEMGAPATRVLQAAPLSPMPASPTAQQPVMPASQPVAGQAAPVLEHAADAASARASSTSDGVPFEHSVPVRAGQEMPADVAAPEPAAEGTPAATTAAPVETPVVQGDAAGGVWDTALAHLKKASAAYGVIMMNATPIFDEAYSSLTVKFAPENEFAFNAAQKPEVREALEAALAKAGAANMAIRFVQDEESAAQPHLSALRTKEPVSDTQEAVSTSASAASPSAAPVQSDPSSSAQDNDEEVPLSVYENEPVIEADVEMAEPAPTASSYETMSENDTLSDTTASIPQDPSADDLNDALAAAFGDGISFQAVEE